MNIFANFSYCFYRDYQEHYFSTITKNNKETLNQKVTEMENVECGMTSPRVLRVSELSLPLEPMWVVFFSVAAVRV